MLSPSDLFIRSAHWDSLSEKTASVDPECPEDITRFAGQFSDICRHRSMECREIGVQMRDEESNDA